MELLRFRGHSHPSAEGVARRRFASQAEARVAVFGFVEGWYNPVRLHAALSYRSPIKYERQMQEASMNT